MLIFYTKIAKSSNILLTNLKLVNTCQEQGKGTDNYIPQSPQITISQCK